MRFVFGFVLVGCLSGCSVNAGVGARFGQSEQLNPECDNFESCDVAYQEAVEVAQRCHEEDEDCEDADRNVRVTYGALRERTTQELGTLRAELEDQSGDAYPEERDELELDERSERNERVAPRNGQETAPAPRHGNTWFDSDSASE